MKTIKNILLLPVILLVLLSVKCHDKPPQPPVEKHPKPRDILLPQIVKDYFVFKVGTYWIYQDSATGITDSVYVKKARDYISPQYNSQDNYFYGTIEGFNVECESANFGQEFTAWYSTSGAKLDSPQYDTCLFIDGFRDEALTGHGGTGFVAYYPFTLHAQYHWWDGAVVEFIDKAEVLDLNGYKYLNTITFNNNKSSLYDDASVYWTFSPHVGLIQKRAIGQKTWNLIRYLTIQ